MTTSSINSVSLMNLAKLAYLRHYHSLFHSSIHILVPFTVLHLRSDLSSYYVRGYQNLVAKINLVIPGLFGNVPQLFLLALCITEPAVNAVCTGTGYDVCGQFTGIQKRIFLKENRAPFP